MFSGSSGVRGAPGDIDAGVFSGSSGVRGAPGEIDATAGSASDHFWCRRRAAAAGAWFYLGGCPGGGVRGRVGVSGRGGGDWGAGATGGNGGLTEGDERGGDHERVG